MDLAAGVVVDASLVQGLGHGVQTPVVCDHLQVHGHERLADVDEVAATRRAEAQLSICSTVILGENLLGCGAQVGLAQEGHPQVLPTRVLANVRLTDGGEGEGVGRCLHLHFHAATQHGLSGLDASSKEDVGAGKLATEVTADGVVTEGLLGDFLELNSGYVDERVVERPEEPGLLDLLSDDPSALLAVIDLLGALAHQLMLLGIDDRHVSTPSTREIGAAESTAAGGRERRARRLPGSPATD